MGLFRKKEKKDDLTLEVENYNREAKARYASGADYLAGNRGMMPIEDVFYITGRGCVVTGQVQAGVFHVGDTVQINRLDGSILNSAVVGIEAFRKALDSATEGDNVGLLLRGLTGNQMSRGDIVYRV